jgi:predicted acyl esterase
MKKIFLVSCLMISTVLAIAQSAATSLFDQGDSLYSRNEYLPSARKYTLALQLMGSTALPRHYWYAAESWSLAGKADSAFFNLQHIARHDSVGLDEYGKINADKDLDTLHQDARWKSFIAELLEQALKNQITISPGAKIPMRDGKSLNATVYRPSGPGKRRPVIFTLTPYIGDTYHDRGAWFARHGYVYVIVDARGRGSSEGVFYPFRNEAKDGYDIVNWLAHQPFSNGKVAMWGGSYAGFDQWATAKTFPPNLVSIVPAAAVMPGVDFPMVDNIFYAYAIQWLTLTGGHNYNENLFGDQAYWSNKFFERLVSDLPFARLDSLVGNPNPVWRDYMAHPLDGSFYQAMLPAVADYKRMKLPVLTITGAYDGDQPGALSYYRAFMKYAPEAGKRSHYLLIGPWDHAGTRTPKKVQWGVTMGDSSLLDMNQLHLDWYNYVMEGTTLPSLLRDQVVYYIAGADRWKTAARLEDIGRNKTPLFLNSVYRSNGSQQDSGVLLSDAPSNPAPTIYTFNPLEPGKPYSVQYFGPVLEKDQTIAGFFELDLYVQANVKDVDIRVQVMECSAEGRCIPLAAQTMRARYRNSLEKETLLTPGQTTVLHFNRFNFIARQLVKGSRLRLTVSTPSQAGEEINFGSGGVVQKETRKDAKPATIKILNLTGANSLLRVPLAE